MDFLSKDKLLIVGSAGMIGSNMAQTAMMMHLTPNICIYDPYAPALEGVAEELLACAFEGVNLSVTSDVKEAFYWRCIYSIVGRCGPQGRHDPRGFA